MTPTDIMAGWQLRRQGAAGVIALCGDWLEGSEQAASPQLINLSKGTGLARLSFDVSQLGRWNSTLVDFLWEVKRTAASAGIALVDNALPAPARKLLDLLPSEKPRQSKALPPRRQPLVWIGALAIDALSEIGSDAALLGSLAMASTRMLLGRAQLRAADLLTDLLEAGPRAVPIVAIVNFLVGAILGYVGARELRQFAATLYAPNLVGAGAVRELSSLITAIVMAGRSGGAYAARIASMRGNDEIAALQVLGVSGREFLLLPAVTALCVAMPILYLIGCFTAILGGLAVAVSSLGFTTAVYLHATVASVSLSDFAFGISKSIAFAALIGILSCRMGLKARRSAAAVGHAATGAVVLNIVGIIALDSLFAIIVNPPA
ncbi:MAG: MlaE family ABC transporter permease [Steroidobacteraceae bacterium]